MTRIELDILLDRLLKETERRRGLGGYSTDAPGIYDLYWVTSQLTLHLLGVQRKLDKRSRKK